MIVLGEGVWGKFVSLFSPQAFVNMSYNKHKWTI